MTDTPHDFHAAVHAAVKKTIEEVGLNTIKKMSCFKEGRALMADTTHKAQKKPGHYSRVQFREARRSVRTTPTANRNTQVSMRVIAQRHTTNGRRRVKSSIGSFSLTFVRGGERCLHSCIHRTCIRVYILALSRDAIALPKFR